MSMYLPNPDLHPTSSESTELLDVPPMASAAGNGSESPARPSPGSALRLDAQTRLNITRWAEEYIAGLVENHDGGPEDVRTIIHQLHDDRTRTHRDGSV